MTEKDNPTKKRYSVKSPSRGGARPGGGRPAGSKSKINLASAQTLVELMYDRTGQVYEEIVLEDFLRARANDPVLTHKYHNLLAGKLMPDLHKIEHTDSSEAIEQKREAFAAALADVAGIIKNEKQ